MTNKEEIEDVINRIDVLRSLRLGRSKDRGPWRIVVGSGIGEILARKYRKSISLRHHLMQIPSIQDVLVNYNKPNEYISLEPILRDVEEECSDND